jgi:hypothetical protein
MTNKELVSKRSSIWGWFATGAICASLILALPAFSVVAFAQEKNPEQAASQDQSTSKAEPPATPRERELEKQVQDLERRLAAVEAKLAAASAPAKHTETPAPAPASASTASASSPAPTTGPAAAKTAVASSPLPSGAESGQGTSPAVVADVQTVRVPTPNPGQKSQQNGEQQPGQSTDTLYWGEFNPGRGFTVAKSEKGDLNISGYMVARYLNQLPAGQTAIDHLGRPLPVTPRNDFQFHRVLIWIYGYLFSPKFNYMAFLWTVQDTNQNAIGGTLSYNFSKRFSLGLGWNAYPGTISLQGSHPYWTSYDRVMADEFFRPYFTQGLFAAGEVLPRLHYKLMMGNNLSNLDVAAIKLNRGLSYGGALVWLPTTNEFGPRGGFGDFEDHQKLATRFGVAYTYSPEVRQTEPGTAPNNTTLRLADSLNVFDTGALAPGVTVTAVRYNLASANGGMKWHGFWLQSEGYYRVLNHFAATGPLPIGLIRDSGFYVQSSYMVIPKTFELYGGTSWVFSKYGPLGEGSPHEYLGGANWYFAHLRTYRVNLQLIDVIHSPVNSTFGFYMGGLKGPILTIGATAIY